MLSIIIVNHNGGTYTRDCVISLRDHPPTVQHEICIVDNASNDDSIILARAACSDARIILLEENRGFGCANNEGARRAKGEYLFFVNNDTIFDADVAGVLCRVLDERQRIGIAAPALRNDDGSFQLSFGPFPSLGHERATRRWMRLLRERNAEAHMHFWSRYGEGKHVDWVSGAAMLVRRSLFEELGGFDEKYFMYFEDADLCRRATGLGYRVWYEPSVSLIHFGGKSYDARDERIEFEYRRSQLRYYDLHQNGFQRLFLRKYLFLKFLSRCIRGNGWSFMRRIILLLSKNQA